MPISMIFCKSSMFIFPGILSMVDLIPFFIASSALITTGSVVAFIFYILLASISKSLYFENFSTSFIETFLSEGIVISINWYVLLMWSLTMMPGLSAFISLSVCTCISQIKVVWSLLTTASGL